MKYLFPFSILALPVLVSAQATTISDILDTIADIITGILPLLIAVIVIVFVFGLITYVAAKDPEEKNKAKGYIIWGIVILFVVVAIWGLVGVLANTFGVGPTPGAPNPPALPGFRDSN